MKKTALLGGILVLFFAIGVQAQEPEPEKKQTDPYSPYNNPTVTAITSKYALKEMPGQLTVEKIFPAIGKYEFTADGATNPTQVTVTLDPEVKGVVWVEGLPQGKFKALLRQSPATYKIPSQKNEEDKEVAEGTLIYDQDAKTLSVIIGQEYNVQDPASAFTMPVEDEMANAEEMKVKTAKSKTKVKKEKKEKPTVYVATKIEVEETVEPSSSMN
jgi:hypothetical protein